MYFAVDDSRANGRGRKKKKRKAHTPRFSSSSRRAFSAPSSLPLAAVDRCQLALAPCCCGRGEERPFLVVFSSSRLFHLFPFVVRPRSLWKKKKPQFPPFRLPSFSLPPLPPAAMGDDHGPAVGEDFKYATGLTTAGETGVGEEGQEKEWTKGKIRGTRSKRFSLASCTFCPLSLAHLFQFPVPIPPPPFLPLAPPSQRRTSSSPSTAAMSSRRRSSPSESRRRGESEREEEGED